jgi:hypothetical protein
MFELSGLRETMVFEQREPEASRTVEIGEATLKEGYGGLKISRTI